MTKLYIREYAGLARTEQGDSVDLFCEDGNSLDSVADYTAAAAAHTFAASTRWVQITSDAICSYVISPVATPVVATAANFRLPAGTTPVKFRIPDQIPAQGKAAPTYQISVITNS